MFVETEDRRSIFVVIAIDGPARIAMKARSVGALRDMVRENFQPSLISLMSRGVLAPEIFQNAHLHQLCFLSILYVIAMTGGSFAFVGETMDLFLR